MNWTGGSLQRSKKANKGTLQKQRAHFARARARLQDGPDRHRASNSLSPLHPGFFRDVDTEGPRSTLRSFSSRSVRHAGRSKTLKGRSSRATASPVASDRISPSQAAGRRRLHGPDRDDTTIRDMGGTYAQKRKADDGNPEDTLLEARRKRLLQQEDWSGLIRPITPALDFKARDKKHNIRNIRKTTRDHHALTMVKGQHHRSRLVPDLSWRRGIAAALHDDLDMDIRVGTAALTNLTSTHRTSTQSHASSDGSSMLLDNEAPHPAAPRPGLQLAQTGDRDPRRFVGAHKLGRATTQQRMRGELLQKSQPCNWGMLAGVRSSQDGYQYSGAAPGTWHRPQAIDPPALVVSPGEQDKVSGCHGTQQIEGVSRSLRLIHDMAPEDSAAIPGGSVSPNDMIGEATHGRHVANARRIQSGNASSAGASSPRSIDDGPWKAFLLSHSTNSSSSLISRHPSHRRSRVPAHGRPDAESGSWSRQATQGARTRSIKSSSASCMAATLGSPTRLSDGKEAQKRLLVQPEPFLGHGRASRDENDGFWRMLVFGGDRRGTTTDTAQGSSPPGCARKEEEGILAAGQRCIPSSVEVSLSSTPFNRPPAAPSSCVSDNAQDAATRAPLATSSGPMLPLMMISSSPTPPASGDGAAKLLLSEDDGCRDTWQHQAASGVGTLWMSHAPLHNVSSSSSGYRASPSKLSGGPAATRASHAGLDRRPVCNLDMDVVVDGHHVHAWGDSRVRASTYDIVPNL